MIDVAEFFMATMLVVMSVGITVTMCALCVVVVKGLYQNRDS